jgi:5-methylcytosine-specific restriction enzyme B
MIQPTQTLEAAIAEADRASIADGAKRAEEERQALLARFPRGAWPEMSLEAYAIGHADAKQSFCQAMEFDAPALGSIRGSSARKLIIYKHRDGPGWFFPEMFLDERAAWEHLRLDFIRAFELAEAGAWEETETLELLAWGRALTLKTLHLYFPDEILPIYSTDHLRHYLRALRLPADGGSPIQLNRSLLGALRAEPALAGWSTQEMMRLLYAWLDPREARRVYKIAPGEGAEHWDACFAGGYICIGWDELGDLEQYASREAFREAFTDIYREALYKGVQGKTTEKANEVWTFRELAPGDLIVANQGISRVLAVGEVVEPGYVFRDDRETYKHTVTVSWDTSYARTIPPQRRWGLVTLAKVADTLLETILSQVAGQPAPVRPKPAPVDPHYLRMAGALERKGQLVLYGPPGTGKTYTARRLAVWWLLHRTGDADAASVLTHSDQLAAAERRLSTPVGRSADVARAPEGGDADAGIGALTRVTFHPSYAYEDFVEGFRPVAAGGAGLTLRLEDGIFKRVCRAAQERPSETFLVLIDEINRGNVAKVLGELLTLLERDKRGLTVTLPQSKETFAVPPNVYVLGTMNTADRSIKLMDAALRRRFAFEELMPDVDILRGARVGALPLDAFLEELNHRIATHEGREKQIGHAYLLDGGEPVSDPEDFAARFREEILPLLQEYCYEDYTTLAQYIGAELVDVASRCLERERIEDAEQLVTLLARELCGDVTGE